MFSPDLQVKGFTCFSTKVCIIATIKFIFESYFVNLKIWFVIQGLQATLSTMPTILEHDERFIQSEPGNEMTLQIIIVII